VQGCEGARVRRCESAKVRRCEGARVQGCKGARVRTARKLAAQNSPLAACKLAAQYSPLAAIELAARTCRSPLVNWPLANSPLVNFKLAANTPKTKKPPFRKAKFVGEVGARSAQCGACGAQVFLAGVHIDPVGTGGEFFLQAMLHAHACHPA
jgi:hypothetical protein